MAFPTDEKPAAAHLPRSIFLSAKRKRVRGGASFGLGLKYRRAARWLAGLSFGSRLATALAQQTIIRV